MKSRIVSKFVVDNLVSVKYRQFDLGVPFEAVLASFATALCSE